MSGVVVDPPVGGSALGVEPEQAGSAGHLLEPAHGLLVAVGGVQLGHRALETREAAGGGDPGCPEGQQLADLVGDGGPGDALAQQRVVEHAAAVGGRCSGRPVVGVADQGDAGIGAAHHAALEGQRHAHHGPAAVDVAEPPLVADADVVVEGGVRALGGHGRHRLDLDARGVHRHQEHREALVLGDVGVRSGQEDHPVGLVGHRGPHLLAVDHPLVAVAHRPSGDGGHVRPVVGLAVAEAAVVPAGEQFREHLLAVEVGADGVDDARHEHGHGQPVVGGAGLLELVEEDVELDGVAVAVAGHGAGQQAGIGEGAVEVLVVEGAGPVHRVDDVGGEVRLEECPDLVAEGGGTGGEGEVHQAASPTADSSRRSARRRHSRAGSSSTRAQARARR